MSGNAAWVHIHRHKHTKAENNKGVQIAGQTEAEKFPKRQ